MMSKVAYRAARMAELVNSSRSMHTCNDRLGWKNAFLWQYADRQSEPFLSRQDASLTNLSQNSDESSVVGSFCAPAK
mgnify:CR=1 FL=1